MLKQLRLVNFRAFEDFTVSFGEGAYLVGPNNAGKSTLLTALRTAEVLLRHAYRRNPDVAARDGDSNIAAYPASLREFPALRDSLRYEFGDDETRLELDWKSGAKLTAVWPAEEADEAPDGFFYLTQPQGYPVFKIAQARASFPPLGVIPILGPAEHTEGLLREDYVRSNLSSRLSSRHFRNQLHLLDKEGQLRPFLDWAKPWLGDVRLDRLGRHLTPDGYALEVFYYEQGSRVPKEIVWAGDGIQVWLQLLYHVYRVRDLDTIILDEPEVYLHPDLQRRLVHLLESTGKQIIVATHSAEMVAESDGFLTTIVDRNKKRAHRPRAADDFELLSSTLGTAFNLRLARALRSRVALFVEGQDMTILRRFARTLGLGSLEAEAGVTIIPLQGYSNWGQVEPFTWLCGELLPEAIETFVILDRDYRTAATRQTVMTKFGAAGIHGHVWQKKELESYLLTPSVIARLAGAQTDSVSAWIDEITEAMESDVFGRLLNERLTEEVDASNHAVTVTTRFKQGFDLSWADASYRRDICPPKQVISKLNRRLQDEKLKPVSMKSLARAHRKAEIDTELADVLRNIEASL